MACLEDLLDIDSTLAHMIPFVEIQSVDRPREGKVLFVMNRQPCSVTVGYVASGNCGAGKKRCRRMLASTILWFLGRGFQAVASVDASVRREVESWPEGIIITMTIAPNGPSMTIKRSGTRVVFCGSLNHAAADIRITFKSLDGALLVLMGVIGIDQAYSERRFTLKGDLALGMSIVRCVYVVEDYLFPSFITNQILKKRPARSSSRARVYFRTVMGIG